MLTPFHIVIKYPLHITNRRKKKKKYHTEILPSSFVFFFSPRFIWKSHIHQSNKHNQNWGNQFGHFNYDDICCIALHGYKLQLVYFTSDGVILVKRVPEIRNANSSLDEDCYFPAHNFSLVNFNQKTKSLKIRFLKGNTNFNNF